MMLRFQLLHPQLFLTLLILLLHVFAVRQANAEQRHAATTRLQENHHRAGGVASSQQNQNGNFYRAYGSDAIADEYIVILKSPSRTGTIKNQVQSIMGGSSEGTVDYTFSSSPDENKQKLKNGFHATIGDEEKDENDVASELHIATVRNITEAALNRLIQSDEVEFVEMNQMTFLERVGEPQNLRRKLQQQNTKNNTNMYNENTGVLYGRQSVYSNGVTLWGLDRIDQRDLPLDGEYSYGTLLGEDVDIYVLDTGIYDTHTEFYDEETKQQRASCLASFVNGQDCLDGHSHGTHCAGIAGGNTYGVAKKAKLIGVKVLANNGTGKVSQAVYGINWVIRRQQENIAAGNEPRPSIITMSLGTNAVSVAMNKAIDAAIANGIFFTAAAGNANVDACERSPGSSSAVVVGATDRYDSKATFSNYGACVDIFAPGVAIWSSTAGYGTARRAFSGTSMATPHVAGAAALYLGKYPQSPPKEVAGALIASATVGDIQSLDSDSPNLLLRITDAAPTPAPTMSPTTSQPTSASPTTASPATASPTTASPTTASPTTESPTTESPTTVSPTTVSPTTVSPTTVPPTTVSPTTTSPTTVSPTTTSPTTVSPTTTSPTTDQPTSASPTTVAPTTAEPTTPMPTTMTPTTGQPTSANPTTPMPTTPSPTTHMPMTASPTHSPTKSKSSGKGHKKPSTLAPTTEIPVVKPCKSRGESCASDDQCCGKQSKCTGWGAAKYCSKAM